HALHAYGVDTLPAVECSGNGAVVPGNPVGLRRLYAALRVVRRRALSGGPDRGGAVHGGDTIGIPVRMEIAGLRAQCGDCGLLVRGTALRCRPVRTFSR